MIPPHDRLPEPYALAVIDALTRAGFEVTGWAADLDDEGPDPSSFAIRLQAPDSNVTELSLHWAESEGWSWTVEFADGDDSRYLDVAELDRPSAVAAAASDLPWLAGVAYQEVADEVGDWRLPSRYPIDPDDDDRDRAFAAYFDHPAWLAHHGHGADAAR